MISWTGGKWNEDTGDRVKAPQTISLTQLWHSNSPCQWLVQGWTCYLILVNSREGKLFEDFGEKCFLVPNGHMRRDSPSFVPWTLPCLELLSPSCSQHKNSASTQREAEPTDAPPSLDPALSLNFLLQRKTNFLTVKPVWVPSLTLNMSLLTYRRPTTWRDDQMLVHSNPWQTTLSRAPLYFLNLYIPIFLRNLYILSRVYKPK